jgi:hypothetical protein
MVEPLRFPSSQHHSKLLKKLLPHPRVQTRIHIQSTRNSCSTKKETIFNVPKRPVTRIFFSNYQICKQTKFNHIESFMKFTFAQNIKFKNWASSTKEKEIWIAK